MDSFQEESQNRIQHQASGNVPDLSHLVEEVNTSEALPNQPPQQKSNPPRKSNMFFILFILGIFFLLSTLSIIGVYVNQERQLADTRGKAQRCISCPGGTCPDGWSYGPDNCAPQATCQQRHEEACRGRTGGGGLPQPPNQPPNQNLCDNSPQTAVGCRNKPVGTLVPYGQNQECICTRTQGTLCSCWNPSSQSPTPTSQRTNTPVPQRTNTPTPQRTNTPTPQRTNTPTPQRTNTPTPQRTNTPTPQRTNTPTPQRTNTPTPQRTNTPTPQRTNTPTPQRTNTPTPQRTNTPTPYYSCEDKAGKCVAINLTCSPSMIIPGTCPSGQKCVNEVANCVAPQRTNTPTLGVITCGGLNMQCCSGSVKCNFEELGLVCNSATNTCVRPTPSCKSIGVLVTNASECCSNYTVIGANGNRYCANPSASVCSNAYPTAQGCFNREVNSSCSYPPNHTCRRTGVAPDGKSLCSCSPNNIVVPTSPPGSQCANEGSSCESKSCCTGLVCQGVAGSRICNRPQIGPDAQCRVGGNTTATCSRIIAFRCNQWFASECLDNPQFFNDMTSAITYVNGCGQIDIVCNGGPNENKLCGDFTIYKDRCGQNPPTIPPATQPPQPTTSIAECRNIKIYRNNTVLTVNEYNTIRPGDQLTLALVAVNATQARFIINNGIPQATTERNSAGEFMLSYTVPNISQTTTFTIRGEVFGNGQWR